MSPASWSQRYDPRLLGKGLPEEARGASRCRRYADHARLRELERENRELKMKVEFLSKAAAYFAAEHR